MTDQGSPSPTAPAVPAGWHTNPTTGQQAWWDGTNWTDPPAKPPRNVAPLALTALIAGGAAFLLGLIPYLGVLLALAAITIAIVAVAKKQSPKWMPLVGGGAAILALLSGLIITSVIATGVRTPVAAPGPTTQAEVEETQKPVETETPEPEPVEPDLTLGQEQAISKAQSYLSFTSFSRTGLIGQLEFEGFDTADSTFAVDYLNVDWNEQAAGKAADYLESSSFSRQGLIDQLLFEGFSQAEAEYGVTAVGY